ncbi:hypothetical protein [Actinoalloteichus hymeniacidonis]|nr:hypothetical protein [Actinoalloteichus hymeniacidonis]MBB5906030.1 hypothetical protein [Actinoalloteichus hymeniacidonis]
MVEDQTVGRAPVPARPDWPAAALEHLLATEYNLTVDQYELLVALLVEAAPIAVARLHPGGADPAESLRTLLRELENAGLLLREGAPAEEEIRLTINGRDRVRAAHSEITRARSAAAQPVAENAPAAATDTPHRRTAGPLHEPADAAQRGTEDGRRCLVRRTSGNPCGLVRTVAGHSETGISQRRPRALVG